MSKYSLEQILKTLKQNPGNSVVYVNENAQENKEDKYIVIKDIHANNLFPTTMCSEILKDYQSPYNSTVVENLLKNGYTIVGSSNMDEFAMGSTSMTSTYGGVENVLDANLTPGGSSSGSAYLVAKGVVPFATGTDTGGSIRQPSAFNGIYGLKPTYGLISRYGTFAFASSFDTIGPMTKTLKDNAQLLCDLVSNDERDQTNFVPADFDPLKTFNQDIKGMRIGVMSKWIEAVFDDQIKEATLKQIERLKELGAIVEEVNIPLTRYSFSLYMILAYAEASSNLNRYDGIRFGLNYNETGSTYKSVRSHFGKEVKKRLIIGTYLLNSENAKSYFDKAQQIRQDMSNDFKQVYQNYDVLIAPTTPTLAFNPEQTRDPLEAYLSDLFTIPANLVGYPSLNIPIGKSDDNRFIGMQIMADQYNEHLIYQVANNLKKGESDV